VRWVGFSADLTPWHHGSFRQKEPGSQSDAQFLRPITSKLGTDQMEANNKDCSNIFPNFESLCFINRYDQTHPLHKNMSLQGKIIYLAMRTLQNHRWRKKVMRGAKISITRIFTNFGLFFFTVIYRSHSFRSEQSLNTGLLRESERHLSVTKRHITHRHFLTK
jgi:hypothetical protein